MVEDRIRVINDLDIQIKELKHLIKKAKNKNDTIRVRIQDKLLLISQLNVLLDNQNK